MSGLGTSIGLAEPLDAISYLENVLTLSVERGASDVHFERSEAKLFVRIRVDGVMHALSAPSQSWVRPVLASLKLLAKMDSTEIRSPQEGVIRKYICGRGVEFRVSVLPTQHGESVVLRVLDGYYKNWDLRDLDMPPDIYECLQSLAHKSHGLFLVAGPTGSGKTTTLYSLLRTMNELHRKLITVEDPVECVIPGVTQVPVRHDQELGFARCIRSFLRHDPDVIMVGEIRDVETAQVAVQASLTGHMVLSTLHAADASGVPNRLVDLGVEPHLVAASLVGVLAQRLVRTCCATCHGCGETKSQCQSCGGGGYAGRSGLFEYLPVDDRVRSLIIDCASSSQIRNALVGMRSLRQEGARLVSEGRATDKEIMKVLG